MIPNLTPKPVTMKRLDAHRVPALVEELCPKCRSSNRPGVVYVFIVVDERGLHRECDVCSHQWASFFNGA